MLSINISLNSNNNFTFELPENATFNQLVDKLADINKLKPLPNSFKLTYLDDEQDEITIFNQDDFDIWKVTTENYKLNMDYSLDDAAIELPGTFTESQIQIGKLQNCMQNPDNQMNQEVIQNLIQKELDRQLQDHLSKMQFLLESNLEAKLNKNTQKSHKNHEQKDDQILSIREVLNEKIVRFEELQENILNSQSLNECGHNVSAFWTTFDEMKQVLNDHINKLKDKNNETRIEKNKQKRLEQQKKVQEMKQQKQQQMQLKQQKAKEMQEKKNKQKQQQEQKKQQLEKEKLEQQQLQQQQQQQQQKQKEQQQQQQIEQQQQKESQQQQQQQEQKVQEQQKQSQEQQQSKTMNLEEKYGKDVIEKVVFLAELFDQDPKDLYEYVFKNKQKTLDELASEL